MNNDHTSFFQGLLGDKGFFRPDNDLSTYEIGARGDKGRAAFILRPVNTDQVSKVMAYCYAHNLYLIPQSGNTGLVGGSIPDESGAQIVISLDRMNIISEIDSVNQSAQIGAGVRLSSLNTAAQEYGLELPIDLGSDPCIGGMVSTNTGGSRYLKYRGMREHVLGVKAVLADEQGTIIDALCPLHKNNTGFDPTHFVMGAGGVFGIVTEVIVRVVPVMRQSAAALLIPSSVDDIPSLLIEIEKRCGTYLTAFEGMSGNAMKAAFDHNPSLASPFGADDIPDYAVLLELGRTWEPRESELTLDEVLETLLSELWELDHSPLENALLGNAEKLWHLRHSISEGVQKSGKLYAFDISFKRGDVIRFRKYMEEQITQHHPELTLCDFGHIGDGAVHSALVLDRDDPRADDAEYEINIRKWVNDIVVNDFGGSYSAEHGLGRKNMNAYHDYTPENIKDLTRAIKNSIASGHIGTTEI
jgi:FAD/FMN-containing dehydrogenase